MAQQILFTQDIAATLDEVLSGYVYDRLFVLTDENTRRRCLPLLSASKALASAGYINIQPDDTHKTLDSLASVWQELSDRRATRHSMMVNLGGGMVTDLGGFAAATFKRGIRYINIPTTLLGAVDAAVGGKTGNRGVCAGRSGFGGSLVFQDAFPGASFVGLCRDVETWAHQYDCDL